MKILASFIIALMLLTSVASAVVIKPAFGWVGLALTGAELAAPYIMNSGIKYFVPTTATTNVPQFGTADSATVKRNAIGSYAGIAKAVAITVGVSALMDYALNHAETATNLHSATVKSDTLPADSVGAVPTPFVVGQKYSVGSYTLLVTGGELSAGSVSASTSICQGCSMSYYNLGDRLYRYVLHPDQVNYPGQKLAYYSIVQQTSSPVFTPATPAEMAQALVNAEGYIKDIYQAELDAAIQSNPNIFTFPNADVMANSAGVLNEKVVADATASVETAKSNLANAITNYNAAPSPETQQALQEATDALQAREKALADAANTAREAEDKVEEDKPENYPNSTGSPLKTVNFGRWMTFLGSLEDVWIFGAMADTKNVLLDLIREPVAPSFTFTSAAQQTTVSLAVFDGIAAVVRWFMGAIASVGVVLMVARWWRG
jgi:hypothetical protein